MNFDREIFEQNQNLMEFFREPFASELLAFGECQPVNEQGTECVLVCVSRTAVPGVRLKRHFVRPVIMPKGKSH